MADRILPRGGSGTAPPRREQRERDIEALARALYAQSVLAALRASRTAQSVADECREAAEAYYRRLDERQTTEEA